MSVMAARGFSRGVSGACRPDNGVCETNDTFGPMTPLAIFIGRRLVQSVHRSRRGNGHQEVSTLLVERLTLLLRTESRPLRTGYNIPSFSHPRHYLHQQSPTTTADLTPHPRYPSQNHCRYPTHIRSRYRYRCQNPKHSHSPPPQHPPPPFQHPLPWSSLGWKPPQSYSPH